MLNIRLDFYTTPDVNPLFRKYPDSGVREILKGSLPFKVSILKFLIFVEGYYKLNSVYYEIRHSL